MIHEPLVVEPPYACPPQYAHAESAYDLSSSIGASYTLIGQQSAPPFLRKHRGIRDYDLVGSHSV